MKDAAISLSLCLSDIPKEKIKEHTNGKKYLQIDVRGRREPDQYGNDVYAIVAQTKEEREAKAEKKYIGQGQYRQFNNEPSPKDLESAPPAGSTDDLPF